MVKIEDVDDCKVDNGEDGSKNVEMCEIWNGEMDEVKFR